MKYFISYFYVNKLNNSFGFGNTEIDRDPLITDIETANKIIDNILQNQHAVIGVDTEAAVEMSRFGILCLLQVIKI